MKRSTKIWLIVAAALTLAGLIILGCVSALVNFNFDKLSTTKYETNEHVIGETFSNISIITNTADIKFVISEDGTAKVVCFEQTNVKHNVSVKDGTLFVEYRDERHWYEYIGINWNLPTITVYLPQSEYAALTVKTDTGRVEIPKAFTLEKIDISTDTGSVKLFSSANGNVKIKTDTGLVKIDNISALSIDVTVSTGEVAIKNSKVGGDVTVKVNTGKAKITNVKCQNFTSTGDTGDLTLVNVTASEKISIERDTGDVEFGSCDASEIHISTDTGDVWGVVLSPKIFITHTDTGKVSVPKSTEGGICEITTDTGDIKVTVKSK